ncbi:MAG: sensor histidine kinase [Frankia sp.]
MVDIVQDDPNLNALPAPRPPGRGRRWLSAHQITVHALIIVPIVVVTLAAAAFNHHQRDGHAWGGVFAALLLLPLIWRRSRPVTVFGVLALVAFVQWLVNVKTPVDAALLLALYTVAAGRPRRLALLAAGILEVGVIMAALRWGGPSPRDAFSGVVFLSGMVAAACAIGINIGGRRSHLAHLEDRAARLERERDQQARLGAAAERARIAREMHDVVAHNLSVMIALADGAAFTLDAEPARAARAIQAVSDTGREALGEMRRLLGVLRDDAGAGAGRPADAGPRGADAQVGAGDDSSATGPLDGDRAPQPGVADLDRLVEQVRAAGLPVRTEIGGEPWALPPGASLTVFRIIQEALTNTLKHGGPDATARVRLRYEKSAVEVDIIDTGAANGGPAAPGGQGLAGMRERVTVYGGTVAAGPRPEGGWGVHARLLAGVGNATEPRIDRSDTVSA